jgi:hypothetical protein
MSVRSALRATGLDRAISGVRYCGRLVMNPRFRKLQTVAWSEYLQWRRQHRDTLRPSLMPAGRNPRRALIVAKGTVHGAQIELGLIKALELGGFTAVVLADRSLEKFYRLAGVREFLRWEDCVGPPLTVEAGAIVSRAHGVDDLLGVEHEGARVGKFALSTTFRSLLAGRLDFTKSETRRVLTEHLAAGMARARGAALILDRANAALAVFMGNRYTGQGELMDVCLERGMDVLTWFDAHRSSSLMLKRYCLENRDRHHGSIGDDTWAELLGMLWTAEAERALQRELHDNYAAGDWYSRGGTQVNKAIVPAAELRRRLQLDPDKKTAVIFPHIVWDATLFWGADLFANYEDWLVETVRAACGNTRVNWIIKIHPAHVAKSAMERYGGEAAELVAIRERVGPLPAHVRVIPPDTDINTFSLFAVMDYCLTVRGTIGIEAASFGARVLTAGTGRYDHRGFTSDSDSQAAYLSRVSAIESLPALTPAERARAQRFAYGAFVRRPIPLTTLSIDHARDVEATTRIRLNARSSRELRQAADLNAFAEWAADGRREDFVWPDPAAPALDRSA